MSIDIMAAVWKNGPANSTDRFVLLSLADRADETGYCYPSYTDIAKRCAVSRPTVVKSMNRLREEGWLRTEAQYKKDGSRSSNGIYIDLCRLSAVAVGGKESLPPLVKKQDHPSKETIPGVVKNLYGGGKESLPKSSINHQSETPSNPVAVLADHFRAKTGIEPPHESASSWRDNWQPTLSAILDRADGDIERAKTVIDASLEFAWGRGNNTKGRTYPVASPHSLRTISVNQAATQQTVAAVADDDTIWQRALAAVTRRDFTDERLKAAIRAIGGTGRIASANGHDTEMLKRSLGHAYRNVAAA